ncbi:MAG TPA: GDYXXLXY domain-containing protein [Opitutus sp.]|nr:GDYXXLXY domain-containing protein [Opitutus sp.]
MTGKAKLFTLLVVGQVVFLLAWAGYHEAVRQHAPEVLLEARPVDPRDLLRGDYMILSYPIGDLPAGAEGIKTGDEVWVLLERRERHHVAVGASRREPAPGAGQLLVRGRVEQHWREGSTARIVYGIERYYVPEGKGTPHFKTMEVEAAVSPAHRLYIKRLLLDGAAYP